MLRKVRGTFHHSLHADMIRFPGRNQPVVREITQLELEYAASEPESDAKTRVILY